MALTRKDFLRMTGLGVGTGLLALTRCSSSDTAAAPPPGTGGGTPGGGQCDADGVKDGAISGNHGHVLSVPAADVQAGVQKDYGIMGTATHSHTVTLTADMFAQLQHDQSIMVTSTTDSGHSHVVTAVCA